jgi:peptide/nickel transport system substrate-binding protein
MQKIILVLAGGAFLGACGGGESASVSSDPFCREVMPRVAAFMERARGESSAPSDPRYGGTVVVGAIAEIADGMNAAVSSAYEATQHQSFVNLMTLVSYDEKIVPQPYLAESWEVSEDGRQLTFHLRRDVYWHDGERTDARDVAFTWEVVTDPLTAFPNAAFWDHYEKGSEGVQVLDDFTVRLGLEPHAEFLDAFTRTAILPEHLLRDVPRQELKQHPFGTQCPVGNGPFVFVEHRSQDRWVFEANPAFPAGLGGRPFVDRYVYRIVPEPTTLLTELLTENVDVFIRPYPDQAQQIMDGPNTEWRNFAFRDYVFVGWNARKPQLSDARVRRAIAMATDREAIVEATMRGYGTVAHSGVPPFHWAYDPSAISPLPHDPSAARALLDQAGWRDRDGDGVRESADGTRLAFSIKYNTGNQLRQQIAEIMQAQLTQVGIEARPQVVEWATLLQQINTPTLRDFEGVVMGWVADFNLNDMDLFHSERIDQPYAWAGTRNPEIDRLLEAISVTVDREAARPLWQEYQRVIVQEQPYTYFYFPDRTEGLNTRVRNVVMDARGDWVNIKDWYLDPASR